MRLIWIVALLVSASPVKAEKPSVAVLDVSTSGIEASFVPLLTEVLTVEVDALDRFHVVSGSDIRSMLGFEKQKDLFGCNEAACLAEIGGALGVEKIVVASIGKLGSTYVVNIKLIDIKKVETQGRVYETVQGEVDLVLKTIRSGVRRMFANVPDGRPAAPVPPVVVEKQPEAPTVREPVRESPPAVELSAGTGRSWRLPVVLWGVGAVALGTGAYFGSTAKQHYDRSIDEAYIGRQTEIDLGERSQLFANLAFGVSAAAIGAGLGFWLFGGNRSATLAVAPNDGGVSLVSSFALDI